MLSGLDFSDLIDPVSATAEEASKNLELVAGKADTLKQAGLTDKFGSAKKQLFRKLKLNLRIKTAVLGPACAISLFAPPEFVEAARPALAVLAFHLATEAARKAEEDIRETLERRRHVKQHGHSSDIPALQKAQITPEQARKNLSKILWMAAVEVASTAMISVEGLPLKKVIETYAGYFTSMTFVNYGISRGIVSVHEAGDRMALSVKPVTKTAGKFMHKAAQGFYRHNRLLTVIGAGFSVGRAYAHVFEFDANITNAIAKAAEKVAGMPGEYLATGATWFGVGAVIGGTGLVLDKMFATAIEEKYQAAKKGLRMIGDDFQSAKAEMLSSVRRTGGLTQTRTGEMVQCLQVAVRALSVSAMIDIQRLKPNNAARARLVPPGIYRPQLEAPALLSGLVV